MLTKIQTTTLVQVQELVSGTWSGMSSSWDNRIWRVALWAPWTMRVCPAAKNKNLTSQTLDHKLCCVSSFSKWFCQRCAAVQMTQASHENSSTMTKFLSLCGQTMSWLLHLKSLLLLFKSWVLHSMSWLLLFKNWWIPITLEHTWSHIIASRPTETIRPAGIDHAYDMSKKPLRVHFNMSHCDIVSYNC